MKSTPIILQYGENSSIQNLGGMAVYQNEFNRALIKLGLENEVSDNLRSGKLLFSEHYSQNVEWCWRIFLGGLRRISNSKFSILGAICYYVIQKYLSYLFSKNKSSNKTVVYHHMSNFVYPDFALIRIARKHNVYLVTTIVDLLEVDYPEYLSASTVIFRKHLATFLKSSTSFFIPITNFIKQDSCNSGLIPNQANFQVIKWGADHLLPVLSAADSKNRSLKTLNQAKETQPFFLFPAKAWAHKGHLKFLEAYAANSSADFKVTLIGDIEPLRAEIQTLVSSMGIRGTKNINILGFVEDKTREQLMNDCKAVILPSCYEGFGFPYFEATFLKKALVSFRTKSLVEFFGDDENSLSVPNLDFGAFVQALIDFDEHGAELETERKFSKIQVLTWETCLLRTLGVYSRILQEIS